MAVSEEHSGVVWDILKDGVCEDNGNKTYLEISLGVNVEDVPDLSGLSNPSGHSRDYTEGILWF